MLKEPGPLHQKSKRKVARRNVRSNPLARLQGCLCKKVNPAGGLAHMTLASQSGSRSDPLHERWSFGKASR
jgi:hypothetical protein